MSSAIADTYGDSRSGGGAVEPVQQQNGFAVDPVQPAVRDADAGAGFCLGWYDTLNLITALANGPGILGMDISEIAPIKGFVSPQFCIARLIYRMLGRVKAGRRVH